MTQADIVWRNARVWISQSQRTSALAARDGVIVAHGAAALELIGPMTQVVDCAQHSLLPGFGDGHAHPIFGGTESLFAPVRNQDSVAQILDAVAHWASAHPDALWIRGEGYDPSLAPKGEFDARWLDEVVPDRPVVLRAADYHTVWVNTKALEFAGITTTTPNPSDGEIVRRPDGSPMGTLREWGAWRLVYDLLPALTTAQRLAALRAANEAFSCAGITWVQDAWVEADGLETWLLGAREGVLTVRANLAWLAEQDWRTKLPEWIAGRERVAREAGAWLTAQSVKFFADGVLEGGTAALLAEYCDCPGSHGIANWSQAELIEAVTAVVAAGFQPHIHAIGDAGIRLALNAIEAATKVHGTANRPVIAHCQLIDPADLSRFADLHITANFEPIWAQLDADQLLLTGPRIGPDRAGRQYQIGTMIRQGGNVSFGSDWPVTSQFPMAGIGVAITRQADDADAPWLPSEVITLDEALHCYTKSVAVQAGAESSWGDLAVGKRADVVLTANDIHRLEPMAIRNVQVVGTWLAGKRVFPIVV